MWTLSLLWCHGACRIRYGPSGIEATLSREVEKNVGPETEARRQGYRSFGENGQAGKLVRPFSLLGSALVAFWESGGSQPGVKANGEATTRQGRADWDCCWPISKPHNTDHALTSAASPRGSRLRSWVEGDGPRDRSRFGAEKVAPSAERRAGGALWSTNEVRLLDQTEVIIGRRFASHHYDKHHSWLRTIA